MIPYDYKAIEKKWQKKWEEAGIFHAENGSDKPKFYALVEFPYPSGQGLMWVIPVPTPLLTSWRESAAKTDITCFIPWVGTLSAFPPRILP